ncbi:MAG: YggS family pyridoxal phosphate-dependent enzyme [Candidatus Melainabacteria bacterium]|nr:YggS family pyridoxal phosphate-dependent enzyme [Candidatus Melainabacteria bacterium]
MLTPSPDQAAKGSPSKVAANLAQVREVLNGSELPVKLIAVTKHATIEQIQEVHALGVHDFGESKIQDALRKREQLAPQVVQDCAWHFIGHLQSNKVKQAVGNFALIHSIDSLKLAREVSRIAGERGQIQPLLLQVKLQPDDNKSGFTADQLRDCMSEIIALPSIKVEGLMTISPLTEEAQVWQKSFEGLRNLRDELEKSHGIELKELSMGMSDDWRDAITYGSTMIRLGRAIFGN